MGRPDRLDRQKNERKQLSLTTLHHGSCHFPPDHQSLLLRKSRKFHPSPLFVSPPSHDPQAIESLSQRRCLDHEPATQPGRRHRTSSATGITIPPLEPELDSRA